MTADQTEAQPAITHDDYWMLPTKSSSEPSDRDREMAHQFLIPYVDFSRDRHAILLECLAEKFATARAEERERAAKIALRSAQAQSAEEEYCCAGVAQDIASRIRSGQ